MSTPTLPHCPRCGVKDREQDVREAVATLQRWLQMREEDMA
jgi:hypothetical protein